MSYVPTDDTLPPEPESHEELVLFIAQLERALLVEENPGRRYRMELSLGSAKDEMRELGLCLIDGGLS